MSIKYLENSTTKNLERNLKSAIVPPCSNLVSAACSAFMLWDDTCKSENAL